MKEFTIIYYANVTAIRKVKAKSYAKAVELAMDFDQDDLEDQVVMTLNETHLDWETLEVNEEEGSCLEDIGIDLSKPFTFKDQNIEEDK